MASTRSTFIAGIGVMLLLGALLTAAIIVPAASSQASECALDPVALPLFGTTPAATIAATSAATRDAPEPDAAAMQAAAETIVGCSNDPSQAVRYSVFTDRYLASLFVGDDPADQPAFERLIATGVMPVEEPIFALEEISDIEPLADGRVALTLRISSPTATVTDRLVLAWDPAQGAWLVDEVLSLSPPPGTPVG